jgi:hypothetical protein
MGRGALILLLFLSSCSASWHLNKAVKKGAELEQVSMPVYLYDTITDTVDNRVIIRTIIKDTMWSVRDVVKYVPKTRWQTRIEYRYDHKRFKDSLKYFKRMYSDSLKAAVKTSKIENRTQRKKDNTMVRVMWLLVVLAVVALILYVVRKFL